MKKHLIAVALMPVGYVLGFMLPAMLVFGIEGSIQQVPTPIAAKVPAQIKTAATFAKLEIPIAQEKPQTVPPKEPRVMPPVPQYTERRPLTPKEVCQSLGDREEAQICEEYPQREGLLNSLVLGEPRTFNGAVLKNFNAVALKKTTSPVISSPASRD